MRPARAALKAMAGKSRDVWDSSFPRSQAIKPLRQSARVRIEKPKGSIQVHVRVDRNPVLKIGRCIEHVCLPDGKIKSHSDLRVGALNFKCRLWPDHFDFKWPGIFRAGDRDKIRG